MLTLSPPLFRVNTQDMQCRCVECASRNIACRPASSISQEALTALSLFFELILRTHSGGTSVENVPLVTLLADQGLTDFVATSVSS